MNMDYLKDIIDAKKKQNTRWSLWRRNNLPNGFNSIGSSMRTKTIQLRSFISDNAFMWLSDGNPSVYHLNKQTNCGDNSAHSL